MEEDKIRLILDEYEELLRYAVVTPKFEPSVLRQSDRIEAHQESPGRSAIMDGRRHETAGIGRRKHGRAPDFTTRTTRIEVSASVKEPSHAVMEGLCPIRSEESSSQLSTSSPRDLQESNVTDLSLSDERVTHIESILDLWSGSLKTNVLTELRKWKLHFIEHHTLEMAQAREKHAAHVRQLTNQLENLKELLRTYEISIGRKDEVIANLTHAIEKQKDRIELMKKFMKWRLQHLAGRQEVKQEEHTDKIADRLYEKGLQKKAWGVWRSAHETKWKDTIEEARRSSAESLRVELSNDYETKVQALNTELEEAKAELVEMHNKRQDYEDAIKKAFMRGVCALNMEAMTIFQGKEIRFDHVVELSEKKTESGSGGSTAKLPPSQSDRPLPPSSLPPPPPPTATADSAPMDNLITSHQLHAITSQTRLDTALIGSGAAAGQGSTVLIGSGTAASIQKMPTSKVLTSAQQKAGRTITARITGRSDSTPKNHICSNIGVLGVSPPMNSVVVEKHHPVTQQTISQAVAAKYPRALHPFSSAGMRPSGHGGKTRSQPHSTIQSIKVVD
ncbi:centrosomal protein POC5 isoform X2 [Hemicordylus capensis]|uniref:centrosomal protein POC5 isoform X2 n=1 Tax=Hemicordylus capensis TaxID=884348 RepID=UPI0023026208|nr:centrosomal protein POC5 isoform X2 [Hemicordylus capensis]